MGKRDLEKEKQLELAAIWGSEVDGEARFPRRRGGAKKSNVLPSDIDLPVDPDVPSDLDNDVGELEKEEEEEKLRPKVAKKSTKEYRLHCFVEPGTELNEVRTVFEAYEPKVELRTAQKGNLLNRSQFAVLTFRNKAMALHAVKSLDGTNQRDRLGVKSLKLNLMLNRHQSRIVRKRRNREQRKAEQRKTVDEAKEDMAFIQSFIQQHVGTKRTRND